MQAPPVAYTLDEAAEALKVSRFTVDRLVERNELPVVDLGSPDATRRTLRVPHEALVAWLTESAAR